MQGRSGTYSTLSPALSIISDSQYAIKLIQFFMLCYTFLQRAQNLLIFKSFVLGRGILISVEGLLLTMTGSKNFMVCLGPYSDWSFVMQAALPLYYVSGPPKFAFYFFLKPWHISPVIPFLNGQN